MEETKKIGNSFLKEIPKDNNLTRSTKKNITFGKTSNKTWDPQHNHLIYLFSFVFDSIQLNRFADSW